jgi:hypothetical protein
MKKLVLLQYVESEVPFSRYCTTRTAIWFLGLGERGEVVAFWGTARIQMQIGAGIPFQSYSAFGG